MEETLKNMANTAHTICQNIADIRENANAISECAASQDTSEETVNNKLKLLAKQLSGLKDNIKYLDVLTYCINRDVNARITPFFREKNLSRLAKEKE